MNFKLLAAIVVVAVASPQLWAADPVRLTLTGHAKRVVDLEFSADGSQLASMAADGETVLWDLKAGRGRRVASIGRTLDSGRYLAFTREKRPILLAGTY